MAGKKGQSGPPGNANAFRHGLATIERLWDDPQWEAEHRSRARDESQRWQEDRLAEAYEAFFSGLLS